jgi:hypothetical protein
LDRKLGESRTGLDTVKKRKNSCPYREENPGLQAHILSLYELRYSYL